MPFVEALEPELKKDGRFRLLKVYISPIVFTMHYVLVALISASSVCSVNFLYMILQDNVALVVILERVKNEGSFDGNQPRICVVLCPFQILQLYIINFWVLTQMCFSTAGKYPYTCK